MCIKQLVVPMKILGLYMLILVMPAHGSEIEARLSPRTIETKLSSKEVRGKMTLE